MDSLPTPTPYLKTVTLRNYKSIAACKLRLPVLSFLVGPNGPGKSNFLDSLGFVADALETSLDHALRERGTIREVRRRSGGRPNHFSIRLDFQLANLSTGHFSFKVGAKPNGGFEVQHEECKIEKPGGLGNPDFYVVKAGRLSMPPSHYGR